MDENEKRAAETAYFEPLMSDMARRAHRGEPEPWVMICGYSYSLDPKQALPGRRRCAACYRKKCAEGDHKYGTYCHRCGSSEELT